MACRRVLTLVRRGLGRRFTSLPHTLELDMAHIPISARHHGISWAADTSQPTHAAPTVPMTTLWGRALGSAGMTLRWRFTPAMATSFTWAAWTKPFQQTAARLSEILPACMALTRLP